MRSMCGGFRVGAAVPVLAQLKAYVAQGVPSADPHPCVGEIEPCVRPVGHPGVVALAFVHPPWNEGVP